MEYLIIGNSVAAAGCIEGIRRRDKTGAITVLSKENYEMYARPLISYLLAGKTTEDKMRYRPIGFYEDNNVSLLYDPAAAIDVRARTVETVGGRRLSYDALLLATGARPIVPPIEGLDKVKHRYTFLTLDDARALGASLRPDSRVLIVGAGLIGLKCAEAVRHTCAAVTVIDAADRVLSSILTREAAASVEAHLAHNGIGLRLNDRAARFEGNTAYLASGETVGFDILVMAVGVAPETALAGLAGIEIGRGIRIDARGETSAKNVYAAGDCAETLDVSSGTVKNMALLPNAYMQGECAGLNMAGGRAVFDRAIPMNAIGFFGLHILSAGSYIGSTYTETADGAYKCLFYDENALKGFILVGDVEKAGIYTALIRERTPLCEIDFELVKQKPSLIAFDRAARREKLGRAV
ncbi:MAG: FAD-dependent oxidoreductase [Clostridiales bacterium]|jgi:NAD(P)H-nitrite reductase large subunit|nr:FAD-dependent oxidoreductase [Clostridiales bacterium]